MDCRTNSDGGRQLGFPTLKLVPSAIPTSSRGTGIRVLGMLVSGRHIKNNVVQNIVKEAWARFSTVRTIEINETTLMFHFESSRDRDQILELSIWTVHGHCLNLKLCHAYMSVDEVDFGRVQVWVQVHGLSLEMFNTQNAQSIGDSIGKCLRVEEVHTMQQRTLIRWVDSRGKEKWASIRYERLTDVCYGCGRIGHSSSSCTEQVRTNDLNGSPIYGPWITGTRPKANKRWVSIGGRTRQMGISTMNYTRFSPTYLLRLGQSAR